MVIEFVNHASCIFKHDGIALITDPWIEGKVFQESWSLLVDSKMSYSDFSEITHIWFSHEHPDHFYPPNLKSIPEEFRRGITILYHETSDKKIIQFCEKLGFKEVIELKPGLHFELSTDFKLMNNPFGDDSWLHIKTGDCSILNTNDCSLHSESSLKKIAKLVGKVDLLMTQFSYANKQGNTNEPEKRKLAASKKLEMIQMQVNVFQPKYTLPFASFVWFSHEENFYLNDHINRIGPVADFLKSIRTTPIVMYPGDIYEVGKGWSNELPIQRYNEAYKVIKRENADRGTQVDFGEIQSSCRKFAERLKKQDSIYAFILSLLPLKVYLNDLNISVLYNNGKLVKRSFPENKAHMITCSEVFNYCFKFNWGFNTTMVSGRFQSNSSNYLRLRIYKNIADSLNHENSVVKRILQKVFG